MVQLSNPSPRLFLSAGEASGDHYGAEILAEMRSRFPALTAFGLGGKDMETQGLDRIVRAEDVAVLGITEVIRHMPHIYGEYRKLVASIKARKPDLAILIDFPDVNLRLAKVLKSLDIPVVYFVSPQLWAWKRSRLKWVQERVKKMLVIFPFEEPFYRHRNVDAEFVGHPLAVLEIPSISRENFAAKYHLNPTKQWISLLPGSRRKEVHLNLPEMLKAATLLHRDQDYEFIFPVASTLNFDCMWKEIKEFAYAEKASVTRVHEAREALLHSRASIVASGTATVQAAVIGNPFIVVYHVSNLTFTLAKRLVRYPAEIPAPLDAQGNLPIGMVNLIAGKRIIPELLQDQFTALNLIAALKPLLEDTPERATMLTNLAEVRSRLLPSSVSTPIQRVCDTVQSLLDARNASSAAIPSASV
ncbi:MAG: lipid-A-disaccharide synthase [Granulicella sp.]